MNDENSTEDLDRALRNQFAAGVIWLSLFFYSFTLFPKMTWR